MTLPKAVVVIGASAGGVEATRLVVAALPRDFDAAVFIVLHIGAHESNLPLLLGRVGTLPVAHARDGEDICAGQIYVAPPDHHLVLENGKVGLTKGPRENWARPAIDPLFRSASHAYGPSVIGVILTGGLNDGTAGLYEIKARGGTVVVQDPADAVNTSMPISALANIAVDHVAPASRIGALLVELVSAIDGPEGRDSKSFLEPQERGMPAEFTQNHPVALTCPDCGGALKRSELGTLSQFSCHIGHVYTAEVMLAAQFLAMERFLEQAMRSMGERAELCRLMGEKASKTTTNREQASIWEAAMREALDQKEPLRRLLTREWLHPPGDGASEGAS